MGVWAESSPVALNSLCLLSPFLEEKTWCEIHGLVDCHLDSISNSSCSCGSCGNSGSSGSKSIINGEKSRVPPVQV